MSNNLKVAGNERNADGVGRKGGRVKVSRVLERTTVLFAGIALAASLGVFAAESADADPQNIVPPDVPMLNPGQTTNAGFQPGMVPGNFPSGQQGGQPNFGQPSNMQNPQLQQANRSATNPEAIKQWFANYDNVRRAAQMNPKERARADAMLAKPLAIVIPGDEKIETKKLLQTLVAKYNLASEQMKQLPAFPETEQLRRGYFQYFTTARNLFFDYLKVQDNIFASDQAGNAIAGTLMVRKQNLEMLDNNNKAFDAQLRTRFGVAPFQY